MIKDFDRACPVCGSRSGEVLHHQDFVAPTELFGVTGVDIVVCSACGMCFDDLGVVQASVDVSYAEHSRYADTTIYEDRHDADDLPPGPPWDLDRLETTAVWLAQHVPHGARVLDAGCATGALIGFMQREGFSDLVGLDPSPVATAQVERVYNVPTAVGSFIQPPSDLGRFDLVVLSHVLEHIVDVGEAVAALLNLVTPGGLVYIEVPDAARYYEYLLVPFHDFNTEHVNHFSGQLLVRLMASVGFSARTTGSKTVMISPAGVLPAVFGLFELAAPAAAKLAPERDEALGVAMRRYVTNSAVLLDEMAARLRAAIGDRPIVIWGAGQLTMKLLAGPLAGVRIEAIVDSARDKWGSKFGDVPVIGPQQLDALVDSQVPVLVSSIHHQDSIVAAVESQFPGRAILTLGSTT